MKERPILFSAPMVRAILEGKKTQTRRVIKPQPENLVEGKAINIPYGYYPDRYNGENLWTFWGPKGSKDQGKCTLPLSKCPYGQRGDRLWVREAFHICPHHEDYFYRADDENLPLKCKAHTKWKPSIHMPRRASRITLEITGIRVERLQDISEEDAVAEGVPEDMTYVPIQIGHEATEALKDGGHTHFLERMVNPPITQDWRQGFFRLWESINGKKSLDANPWVWVVEFKKVEAENDK